MTGDLTRWTLIGAARAGEPQALRWFCDRYRRPVVAYARSQGLGEEAEDLAQEVFLQVFHRGVLDRADPARGRFRNLLLAISKSVVADYYRRRGAEKRGGGRIQALGDLEIPAPGEDSDVFEREWLLALLDACMARLEREHPRYHQALAGFLLERKRQRDVAAALGTTEAGVRNAVHRGKRKLLAYLREEIWNCSITREEYFSEVRAVSSQLSLARSTL